MESECGNHPRTTASHLECAAHIDAQRSIIYGARNAYKLIRLIMIS